MPYIKQDARDRVDPIIDALIDNLEDEGQLNYMITRLCLGLARREGISYAAYNKVIGVLESAKLEFYRRQVTPYEEIKIDRNGDVKA